MDFVRDWRTCISLNSPYSIHGWMPPPSGVCKLNFDGSSRGNPGLSGFGCVIRDSQVDIIKIVPGPLGIADSTKAEVIGLHLGLQEVRALNLNQTLVEGDSSVVV